MQNNLRLPYLYANSSLYVIVYRTQSSSVHNKCKAKINISENLFFIKNKTSPLKKPRKSLSPFLSRFKKASTILCFSASLIHFISQIRSYSHHPAWSTEVEQYKAYFSDLRQLNWFLLRLFALRFFVVGYPPEARSKGRWHSCRVT